MERMVNVLDNIQIVLCNTSHPGNIGSAARAMKTMGLFNLTLVDPIVMPDDHSLALSSNAKDVVLNAKIVSGLKNAISESHLVIGMSGRKREFSSRLQNPREIMPEIFAAINSNMRVSIVFGNEQNGLSIEQLQECNRQVTIPGNPEYFSLNLAQAVQIICYEIYSNFNPNLEHLKNPVEKVNQHDIHYLLQNFTELFALTDFLKNKNPERTIGRIHRILHKADLEREDADLLHGILNKTKNALKKL